MPLFLHVKQPFLPNVRAQPRRGSARLVPGEISRFKLGISNWIRSARAVTILGVGCGDWLGLFDALHINLKIRIWSRLTGDTRKACPASNRGPNNPNRRSAFASHAISRVAHGGLEMRSYFFARLTGIRAHVTLKIVLKTDKRELSGHCVKFHARRTLATKS